MGNQLKPIVFMHIIPELDSEVYSFNESRISIKTKAKCYGAASFLRSLTPSA